MELPQEEIFYAFTAPSSDNSSFKLHKFWLQELQCSCHERMLLNLFKNSLFTLDQNHFSKKL